MRNSIVVLTPVYEDLDSLKILANKLYEEYQKQLYLVVVDDCSKKHPISKENLGVSNLKGEIITLRKNVGHQIAIAIGLNHINKNLKEFSEVVIMDSDGEDRPDSIKDLKSTLNEKKTDIVVSSRKSRQNSLYFKILYSLYKILFSYLTGHRINFGNFMILNRNGLSKFLEIKDIYIHIAASVLISKATYNVKPIDRGSRYRGESKMNLYNLINHAIRSFAVFDKIVFKRILIIIVVSSLFLIGSTYFSRPDLIFISSFFLLIHLIFYKYIIIQKKRLYVFHSTFSSLSTIIGKISKI
ncbi:MAG TPA: glycosyltransferase [Candidatus Dadabacteria bacterium]|nr:glycosyltransferase [Candidatus Dadabacteria bacterium]